MKISTEIGSICAITSHEKAIELTAKAGFDAFDLSMFEMAKFDWKTRTVAENGSPFRRADYLKFVRELKKIGQDCGIHCNQSHAPFPTHVPEVKDYLKRAIECTAEIGAKICVIHPFNHKGAKENAEFYLGLLPFAKEYGVKIATENMWSWNQKLGHAGPAACSCPDDFLAHLEAVNDQSFVACLDIGHAEMKGSDTSAVQMINALGHHLEALHIHDNDLLNDSHGIPFTMNIDFEPIVKALKNIGYSGYFTLEASYSLSGYTEENVFDGVCAMANAAKKLVQMYEIL